MEMERRRAELEEKVTMKLQLTVTVNLSKSNYVLRSLLLGFFNPTLGAPQGS